MDNTIFNGSTKRLFKQHSISTSEYDRVYYQLIDLRKEYPGYRDDELLIFMLVMKNRN